MEAAAVSSFRNASDNIGSEGADELPSAECAGCSDEESFGASIRDSMESTASVFFADESTFNKCCRELVEDDESWIV
jgi:hypothetical protein